MVVAMSLRLLLGCKDVNNELKAPIPPRHVESQSRPCAALGMHPCLVMSLFQNWAVIFFVHWQKQDSAIYPSRTGCIKLATWELNLGWLTGYFSLICDESLYVFCENLGTCCARQKQKNWHPGRLLPVERWDTIPERCLVPFFRRQIFSTVTLFMKQAHFMALFFLLAQTLMLHKLDTIPTFGQSLTSRCLGGKPQATNCI